MKILVIQGHPDFESFTHANAENYMQHAKALGHEVKLIDLSVNDFDPVLRYGYRQHMQDETKPNEWQVLIKWADHLSFFFPVWWSAEPSVLKGFIDRTFTPKFAYTYDKTTGKKIKLLTSKTADIFISSDAPSFLYAKMYGGVVSRWKNFILSFVGIKLKNGLSMGNMQKKSNTLEARKAYMKKCALTIQKLSK